MRYYFKRHSHKIIRTLLVVLVIAGLGIGTKYFIANRGEVGNLDDHKSETTQTSTSPAKVVSRVLATGNVSWGGNLYALSEASSAKQAYPFSGLNTFTRNEYDAWIGNLTCVISNDHTLASTCTDAYLIEAKKWFTVFALSGARTSYSVPLEQTRSALKQNSIQYVGGEDQNSPTNLCDIADLPARYQLGDGSYKVAHLPLALCSFNSVSGAPDNKQLDEVTKYAKVLPTWVYVNSGETTVIAQSELQKGIFKAFIDIGADIVIGNNPSIVQGAESYKGKLILYSLGNFMYSGTSTNSEQHQSVSLKASINADADTNMLAWTQFASQCAGPGDDCIAQSRVKGLIRPNYTYTLSIVPADNLKDGVTMTNRSMWEEQALKRLTWETVLPSLTYIAK